MKKFDCDLYEATKNGKLKMEDKIEIAVKMVKNRMDMQSAKVNHRDIKPQNILVKKIGNKFEGKLTDFGIGKTKEIEGTPGFAPTDLNGNSYYGYHCDSYSFGVLLAFLFFEFDSFWAAMFRPVLNQNQRKKIEQSANKFHQEAMKIIDKLVQLGGYTLVSSG